jgi:pantoate--beta-alanine ligase
MFVQLNMPVEVYGVATVRETDGLAMSSRNGYLTPPQRAIAPTLYQTLLELQDRIQQGRRDYETLIAEHSRILEQAGFAVNYLAVCNRETLLPATAEERGLVILAAAKLGKARLIDNLQIDLCN